MTKLSRKEVDCIAALARLEFSKKEKEKFQKELSSILDYVSQLQKVDTKDIEPISQITGLSNIMRDDKVELEVERPDFRRRRLFKNAPHQKEGYLEVKSVFEE